MADLKPCPFCGRSRDLSIEDAGGIDRYVNGEPADALHEAITDVHKAFLMGEVGLTYEKCAGWREEDGERDAD